MTSEYKETKRDYKAAATQLEETQRAFKNLVDLDPRIKLLAVETEQIADVEKKFKYMENIYNLLPPGDKAEQSDKLRTRQKQYEELRRTYFEQQSAVDTQRNQDELAFKTTAGGAQYKMEKDTRAKNLNNLDTQYDQDDQIARMKRDGIDTQNIMIDTNQDLRQQRDLLINVDEKNKAINRQVDKTNVVVIQMTKTEFWQKVVLWIVIVCLFITDLFVFLAVLHVF